MNNKVIEAWHQFISSKDPAVLAELLAADVSFHSPVVHTPQQGKAITTMYLTTAAGIFNQSFTYKSLQKLETEAFRYELSGTLHLNNKMFGQRFSEKGEINLQSLNKQKASK